MKDCFMQRQHHTATEAIGRRPSFYKRIHREVLLSIALLLVCAGACVVLIHSVDQPVAEMARTHITPAITRLAHQAGRLDRWIVAACLIAALVARIFMKKRRISFLLLLPPTALGIAWVIAGALKFFFGRPRPQEWFARGASDFQWLAGMSSGLDSFPSGHAARIMALMAALAWLHPRLRIPCMALVILLGATRIVAGLHYPSDVLAGFTVGGLTAFWLLRIKPDSI